MKHKCKEFYLLEPLTINGTIALVECAKCNTWHLLDSIEQGKYNEKINDKGKRQNPRVP